MAFAAVMAVVLAATGLFVYTHLASNLDRAIGQALRARAADVAALAQQSDSGLRDASAAGAGVGRAQLAELIDSSGRVLDRTPGLPSRPLLGPGRVAAARRGGAQLTDVRLAGGDPARLLAQSAQAQGQTLVIVVGQSLEDRNRALTGLGGVLLVGGPVALLLASLGGYLLIGRALRPVEAMRRRERAFVSDASHELRSPLAILRTELELLARERPTGAALQSAVVSAIDETDRLGRLADDLLLLARADDRRLVLDPSNVAIAELLHQAADRARRQPGRGDVQIAVDATLEASVLVDRERIAQAIDNLLANALRYARSEVRLTARAHGAFVELHVTDDGPGFPAAFLPRAWERFARADEARTDDGTGLGLPIVLMIAHAHDGEAHAANRSGGGADTWISLPMAPDRRGSEVPVLAG